ncbi:MAG TPA: cyclic nucleotide-binding domain-containing protein [Actinomycetota bacterium]|nr:cyclic nucleotide-binding domain-containing protein [Actinomycetota bacterium]
MTTPEGSFPAHGIFAGLATEDLDALASVGEPASFEASSALFETGDAADAMYVITDGEAKVTVGGRFHILKAGDVVGEMAVLAPGKRMATVTAETPVRTLRVPGDAFQRFLLDHPAVALSIMKQLVIRLREVEQRIDAWMA